MKTLQTLGKLIHVIVGLMDCTLSPDNAMLLYSKVKTFFSHPSRIKTMSFMRWSIWQINVNMTSYPLKEEFYLKSDIKFAASFRWDFPHIPNHHLSSYTIQPSTISVNDSDRALKWKKAIIWWISYDGAFASKETLYSYIFKSVTKDYFYKNFEIWHWTKFTYWQWGRDPEKGISKVVHPLPHFHYMTERYKDRRETREITEWHNIVAWRQLVDLAGRFIKREPDLCGRKNKSFGMMQMDRNATLQRF